MAQDARKHELIAELARARSRIDVSSSGLREDLAVKQRLAVSFQRNRLAWVGGASLFGFLLARLPRRKNVGVERRSRTSTEQAAQKGVVKAGLLVTVLKLAFDVLRPALTKWATQQVASYAAGRFRQRY